MSEAVTIAVDALGGDNAPAVVLDGVADALAADENLHVVLCGPAEVVQPFADAHDRVTPRATTQVIAMGEHPAEAVRTKKDSSIVVGCQLVKDGEAQGFFSAGSTGACLAAATLVVGRIKGVKRPCLGQVLPSYGQPTLLLDVGANADCKPEYLVQFAQMGVVYVERILGVAKPRVALLNIGEEETKGSAAALVAHGLLKEQVPQFVGNCEGGDLMKGGFDVVVTDGFTGNVCLKTIEGTAKAVFRYVKGALLSSVKAKLGALLVKESLGELRSELSPDAYGGAPLLGVKGACVVGHGSSNALAIRNGVLFTAKTVRAQVDAAIAEVVGAAPAKASAAETAEATEATEAVAAPAPAAAEQN